MADYLADVKKYDAGAQAPTWSKRSSSIWALRSGTAIPRWYPAPTRRNWSASRQSWVAKKLGVSDGAKADAAIEKTCKAMHADNSKSRVTFYYLVAKDLGKLGSL